MELHVHTICSQLSESPAVSTRDHTFFSIFVELRGISDPSIFQDLLWLLLRQEVYFFYFWQIPLREFHHGPKNKSRCPASRTYLYSLSNQQCPLQHHLHVLRCNHGNQASSLCFLYTLFNLRKNILISFCNFSRSIIKSHRGIEFFEFGFFILFNFFQSKGKVFHIFFTQYRNAYLTHRYNASNTSSIYQI